ncbi:unnamed protein product, partial [Brassica rapa]
VWAESNFPFPRRGFEHMTLFENFNYLLSLPSNLDNLFLFEGKEYSAIDTVAKVVEDSSHWFEAQKGRDEEVESENREMRARDRWE